MDNAAASLEELLSLPRTQAELGISRSYLFKLIAHGELEVVRIGNRTLVEPATLRAFIAANRSRARSEGRDS